jgi:flagellar basal body-associated protein FliL
MPPAASSPPAQGGGALKVILIVVGVIVLLGILSVASIGFFAWRVARHAHVHQDGNNVTVETPFGSVKTTQDPAEAARNLGVDLYPGAEVSRNGAQSATFGGVHTASLTSESTDSVDKVSSFYKAKFPNAMVSSSDAGRCTIISNDNKTMITINIEARGDKTKIQITRVSRNSDSTNSSSN